MPVTDPMGGVIWQAPVGAPPQMTPGRDPRTGMNLPEGRGSALSMAGNLTGGFNRELGNLLSYGPKLTEKVYNAANRGIVSAAQGLTNLMPEGPIRERMQAQIPSEAPQTNVVGNTQESYNSFFDRFAPQNGWDRGFRRGGEVLADTLPVIAGINAGGAAFGRTAAQEGQALARGTAQAMRANPQTFVEGSKAAVPGMSLPQATAGIPQAMFDAAAAHPTAVGAVDAATSIGSGMGEQFGAEHAQNPQTGASIGSLIGGALPELYSVVSPGMMLGKMVMEGARRAKRLFPTSDTFEARQAERNAYANREGVYEDPNVPAPPPTTFFQGPGKLPSFTQWKIGQQDQATQERLGAARQAVQDTISSYASHRDAQAAAKRTDELEQLIPGYQATLGRRFESPALLKKEEEVNQNLTGQDLVAARDREKANQKAISDFADSRVAKAGPTEGPSPRGFNADEATGQAAQENLSSREQAIAQDRAAPTEDQLRTIARNTPNPRIQDTGAQIRQGYAEGRERANAQTEANKQAIRDEAGDTTFPGNRINQGLQQDMRDLGTDLLPEEITPPIGRVLGRTATPEAPRTGQDALLPRAAPEAPQFTADDLLEAQKSVNEQIRALQSGQVTTTDTQKLQRLSALRDRLQAEERNLGEEGSAVRQRFEEFRRQYRDEVVPNYRQGLGADINERTSRGEPKLQDAEITRRVTNPDAIEENRQNLRVNREGVGRQGTIGANMRAMRDAAYDPKTGMFDEDRLNAFLSKNADRLSEDPELRGMLEQRNRPDLYRALNQAHEDIKAVKDSELAKMFGPNASFKESLDEVFSNPQLARQVKTVSQRDPDLDAALKRAVWERAAKDPEKTLLSDQNRQAMNVIYGDNSPHLADLRAIADAARKEGLLKPAQGKPVPNETTGNKVKELTGISIPSAFQQARSVEQGRQGGPFTTVNVGMSMLNKLSERDMERAWKEAFTNPQLAKVLAASARNGFKLTPMMQNKISSYILVSPETQNKGVEQDAPQPSRKRAP